jgi:hypothetical protein
VFWTDYVYVGINYNICGVTITVDGWICILFSEVHSHFAKLRRKLTLRRYIATACYFRYSPYARAATDSVVRINETISKDAIHTASWFPSHWTHGRASNSGPIVGTARDAGVVTSTITSRGSDDRIFCAGAIDIALTAARIFSDDQPCQCRVKNHHFRDLFHLCPQGGNHIQKILAHLFTVKASNITKWQSWVRTFFLLCFNLMVTSDVDGWH